MRAVALAIARRAFHAVPRRYRKYAVDIGFTYAGFLLSHSPAYIQWQQRQRYKEYAGSGMSRDDIDRYFSETDTSSPCFLLISHGRGGGTESHIKELSAALREAGKSVWVLRMVSDGIAQLLMERQEPDEHDMGVLLRLDSDFDLIEHALGQLTIEHIHLHHTLDFPDMLRSWLPDYASRCELPFDITLHDYFAICPRFTLTDESTHAYCGEPESRRCTICVHRFGSPVGNHVDVPAWRAEYGTLMRHARMLYVPNEDVATRLSRYYPDVTFTTHPHFDARPENLPPMLKRADDEPLRVVAIGAIAPHKGSKILFQCAEDAKARKLPIHFTILGFTDIDHRFRSLDNVTITGPYKTEELAEHMRDIRPHIALFPNVWPETYCYTLSEALRAGLYPITLDIGAVAQRLRALQWGEILPLEYCTTPQRINDALLAAPINTVSRPDDDILHSFTEYKPFLSSYYSLD